MPQAVAAAAVWVGNAIGTAVGATLTAAGVAASTALPLAAIAANAAYLVAEIAIYSGLQALIDDIANEKAAPQGYELALRNAADVPREMIIGQRAVAGSVIARYSRGQNLYNAHFVYQVADHPCTELSKVYGDGRLVRSTPLTHGTRTEISAYSYSGGARVWMTWWDGRAGQTADTNLITNSALDPDVIAGDYGAWTSDHRGAGCAYVHVEVQFDSDILTSIPEFLFDVKGAPLYDRRKDTTAGGSGTHRHATPSTWEWTANAAVALDHYMLGYKVENDALAFGVGLSAIEVPYATFAALADLCDEDVVTGVGGAAVTINRYEANGIVSAAEGFESVIETFANQMCARVVDLGGEIGVLGGDERTSVVTLDDDDWASDESVRFAPHLAFSDLYGAVVGSFPDPENLWQPTPYARQTTSYLQLPDGGEASTAQLDLPFETNSRRAVRIAAAWIARESLQPRLAGTFATRSNAWRLAPGDWFTFSSTRLEVTSQLFEVVDNVRHEDFTVTLTARAIDPNFLAFSVGSDVDLSVPPALDPFNLRLDLPTFSVTASTIEAGAVVEPVIEFTLTSDEEVAREIVIEYGKWDGTMVLGPTFVDSIHVSQIVSKIRKGILPSTSYKVRAKAKAGVRESDWTAYSAVVTTGAAFSSPATSVPWSGVVDDGGRPDNNADVTSANTAAAIAGQGAFATLNSAAYGSALLTGFGALAPLGAINFGSAFLLEAAAGAQATLTNFKTALGTAAAFTGQAALATLAFTTLGSNVRLADGTTIATNALLLTSLGTAAAITGQGGLATLGFTTLGSNVRLADGVTVATNALLLTSLGTAAAITGQGALATKATIDSSALISNGVVIFSALSSTAVRLGTNITRADGTTSLTDALAVTSLGTAASITGQGGLATLGFTTIGTNTRRADGTTVATEALLVTSLGTAASITGQGSLATISRANIVALAGSEAINNAVVPIGVNAAPNTEFLLAATYPPLGWSSGGVGNATGVTFSGSIVTAGARRAIKAVLTGTVGAGATYSDAAYTGGHSSGLLDDTKRFALPVVAGDTVAASALVTKNASASAVFVNVVWVTDGGAYISEVAGNGVTQSVSGDSGNPADYALSSLVAVAPANARFAIMYVRMNPTPGQVNPTSWFMSPLIARVPANQTAVPAYTPGEVDRRADMTSANTAAAFLNQAALATLNFTTIGSNVRRADGTTVATEALLVTSLGVAASIAGQGTLATLSSITGLTAGSVTGQGALATLNQVNLGASGRVYRDDGTTRLTDALAVTSLGTAASIVSQGAFATLSSASRTGGLLTGFGAIAGLDNGSTLTAGSITSQGGLATLNFTQIGTNVRRADGTTVATEALLVTSLGTAASITGQGSFATLSSASRTGGLLTGFGAIAGLDNGSTLTAGAITGQGAFATLSSASRTGGLLTGFGSVAGLNDGSTLTAGAITGQGYGATASEDQVRASRDGLTINERFDAPFAGSGIPPGWSDWSNGAANTTYITKPIGSGKCAQINAGAGADGGIVQNVPVAASQDYLLVGEIRRQSGTTNSAGIHCQFYNASNVAIGPNNLNFATEATTAGVTTTTPDGVQRWEKVVTAPAGATYCLLYAMSHWSGFGRDMSVANSIAWYECSITPMSLVRQLRADVTNANTAAAFTGQGALATLSSITGLTAGAITGQGGLATLSFVTIATNLRLADGTTVATTAMVVTSAGTAAAIAGQGALATKNQAAAGDINVSSLSAISADLGNITSGAIDLTANSYVVRHGAGFGAASDLVMWYGLASIARSSATKTNGVFALATDGKVYYGSAELVGSTAPMTATITGDFLDSTRTTAKTPTINVSPAISGITNGTSPYTYSWSLVEMRDGTAPTLTDATTASCTLYRAATLANSASYDGTWQCLITDANGKICVKYYKYSDFSAL